MVVAHFATLLSILKTRQEVPGEWFVMKQKLEFPAHCKQCIRYDLRALQN